jgi:hypothetical protein
LTRVAASAAWKTEEDQRIRGEVLNGDGNQVARIEEPSVRVPDAPFALQTASARPAEPLLDLFFAHIGFLRGRCVDRAEPLARYDAGSGARPAAILLPLITSEPAPAAK